MKLTDEALTAMVQDVLVDALESGRSPSSIHGSERLFVDLGLDSVAYLQVWTAIEGRIGRPVDDEDLLGEIRTVSDLIARVKALLAEVKRASAKFLAAQPVEPQPA